VKSQHQARQAGFSNMFILKLFGCDTNDPVLALWIQAWNFMQPNIPYYLFLVSTWADEGKEGAIFSKTIKSNTIY
jgi:hypothetical protein